MKTRICANFICLLSFFSICSAQQNSPNTPSDFWKKVRFGGNLSVQFSNNNTAIIVSPSALYQFNEKFLGGIGLNFGYSKFDRENVQQYNYGASLIGLYNPIQNLQLSGELEQTFVNATQEFNNQEFKSNFDFLALYLGAGYRVGNFTAGVRYDVLYDEDRSIYRSPISPFFRVYF